MNGEPYPLRSALARSWWLLMLRGVCAILFCIFAFAWPSTTLLTLILFWGAYALADGIFSLGSAFFGGSPAPRWWLILVGLAGLAAGVLTFMWPGITGLILLLWIAVWAIVTGVLQIAGGISLRREITGEWVLIASGLLSLAFGVLMVVHPGAGAIALLWVIGGYAIAYGVLLVWFAFRVSAFRRRLAG